MPREMWRKAISVMFMTFIAVSILTAIFITMYLYLTQHNLTATEVQRIYAEASREKLEVYLDPKTKEIIIRNMGGIGVIIKYLVGLDDSSKTANLQLCERLAPTQSNPEKPSDVIISANECPFPEGELYVLTERGNMFKAARGGFKFELEASPAIVTVSKGESTAVSLKLKAVLLESPESDESGLILLVAKPEDCIMTGTVTRTITTTMTATIAGVQGQYVTLTVRIRINGISETIVTFVTNLAPAGAQTMTATTTYTTTYTTMASFVKSPQPTPIATFSKRTTAMVIVPAAITAESLDWWAGGPQCFIVYKAVNATSGSVLAETWVKVESR